MVHRHAFRAAGASRREEDIAQVIRPRGAFPFECDTLREVELVDQEQFDVAWEKVGVFPVGDHHRRSRILQHQGDPVLGIGRVDGHISGTCLEDAQYTGDEFRGALQTQAHIGPGLDALMLEVRCQLVHFSGQFAVGQGGSIAGQGRSVGLCGRRMLKEGKNVIGDGPRLFRHAGPKVYGSEIYDLLNGFHIQRLSEVGKVKIIRHRKMHGFRR